MKKFIKVSDYFGVAASTLCLIHCLCTPLLLASLPIAAIFQDDETFHRYMVAVVTLFALLALIPGFTLHRKWRALILGGLGLACFVSTVFVIGHHYGELTETVLVVFGGLLLLSAHLLNRRFCRVAAAANFEEIYSAQTRNSVAKTSAHGS